MKRLSDACDRDLEDVVARAGEPRWRVRQLRDWISKRGVFDPAEMANVPGSLRQTLAAEFPVRPIVVDRVTESRDGTIKVLLRLFDERAVESVIIPAPRRTTLCLSSQVGCAVGCVFCASGIRGGQRNLTHGEIFEEFMTLRRIAQEHGRSVTNLVMMGMGEPMLNVRNVLDALDRINSPLGPNLGARRITVSTVGISRGLETYIAAEPRYTLALSLHAPNDDVRRRIVPLTAAMKIEELVAAARRYLEVTGREVTFEYVLLHGVNDQVWHARELADRLRGVRANVNLIPLNPVTELPYAPPPETVVDTFAAELSRFGVKVSRRTRKGADIDAACGQLALKAARGG